MTSPKVLSLSKCLQFIQLALLISHACSEYDSSGDQYADQFYDYYDSPQLQPKTELKQSDNSVVVDTKSANNKNKESALDDYYEYTDDYEDYEYKAADDKQYEPIDSVQSHQFIDPETSKETTTNAPLLTVKEKKTTPKTARSKLLEIMAKPGILAGIVGGAIIGVLTAILLIMFIVYRMKKKDEGSYALEETKKPLNAYDYRHCPTKEFYA